MKIRYFVFPLLLSCSNQEPEAMVASSKAEEVMADGVFGGLGAKGAGRGGGGLAPGAPSPQRSRKASKKKDKRAFAASVDEAPAEEGEMDADDDQSAATRSWFPETFLFEPLLKTDQAGKAEVSVKVPDRLTTWRVLALAHSRAGAQAGAVTTFLGTLPTYVDPILPGFLMAGDEVDLPIQVVNTSSEPVRRNLRLEVKGAALVKAAGEVSLQPNQSVVHFARVKTGRPGTLALSASFGDKDRVEREVPVYSKGKPMREEHSGTLAAPRTVRISLPSDTERESVRARLSVFPGALAVLKSELAQGLVRGGLSQDAYMLMLSGRAEALLKQLKAKSDPEALRKLRLVATQRVMRHARSPGPGTAALLARAALSHPNVPVLARMGERLASQVARSQRPDGTFQGGSGWTLQRLLVATAEGLLAVQAAQSTPAGRHRATGATLKASGAFERHFARIEDPYTAAAVVASGAVSGTLKKKLLEKVKEAIKEDKSGAKSLTVPSGVVRPDGLRPGKIEATALAVLALSNDESAKALLPDLGAALLSAYRPSYGFGDGRASLVALMAVLEIFKDPLPSKVTVRLLLDGRSITQGVLEGERLRQVLSLDAAVSGGVGAHKWQIKATPAVPGLGFSLTVRYHLPWKLDSADDGLELSVETPKILKVGVPADMMVRTTAPGGAPVRIRVSLPAGVQVDPKSLDGQVLQRVISKYEVEDGALILDVPSMAQGQSFNGKFRVIPSLSGTLHTAASSVALLRNVERAFHTPPVVWKIAR